MKTASVKEIRQALAERSPKELLEICLRLSRFKKENKELLTYLLFEASDEMGYINGVKSIMDEEFADINARSFFYIKKSVRKILRNTKKYIRYSPKKETEVELLLYFCQKLQAFRPSISRNRVLKNLYYRQIDFIEKKLGKLHEDLQYDYGIELENLREL